jgi:hypothetical protein
MLLKECPVYNASLESENRLINVDTIEEVKPHANVPVDPGAVDTSCVEVRFHSGEAIVVLVDYSSMRQQLSALVGNIDELANLS